MSMSRDAYFAGFLDGEGYVSVGLYDKVHTRLMVNVSQVDRRPLDMLAARFGGSVKKAAPRAKPVQQVYYWQVWSQRAATMLRDLLPFLVVKRAEAALAVVFAATMRPNTHRDRGHALTGWETAERLSFVEAFVELRRGRRSGIHDTVTGPIAGAVE